VSNSRYFLPNGSFEEKRKKKTKDHHKRENKKHNNTEVNNRKYVIQNFFPTADTLLHMVDVRIQSFLRGTLELSKILSVTASPKSHVRIAKFYSK
jgi:hypothetical protein